MRKTIKLLLTLLLLGIFTNNLMANSCKSKKVTGGAEIYKYCVGLASKTGDQFGFSLKRKGNYGKSNEEIFDLCMEKNPYANTAYNNPFMISCAQRLGFRFKR